MTEIQMIEVADTREDRETTTVAAELVCPGLFINPGVGEDGFTGDFLITHGPSGRMIGDGGCVDCVRKAVRFLVASGVDWTKPMEEMTADPAAKQAAEKAFFILDDCPGSQCAWAGAS